MSRTNQESQDAPQERRPPPRRQRAVLLGLALCLSTGLLLAGLSVPSPVLAEPGIQADPVVRCEPEIVSGTINDTLTVQLYVEDVVNLYGVDLQLSFNTSIGQVVDEVPFMTGVQIMPISGWLVPGTLIRWEANNTSGTVWYAATQNFPEPPKSGEGAVASVRFTFKPGGTAGCFTMPFTNHQLSAPGGVPIYNTARSCTVCFGNPTRVRLAYFRALPGPGSAITLKWRTTEEIDNAGFNLYRSESRGGTYAKLNQDLIPTKVPPGSPIGATYKWRDQSVESGMTYFYKLEDVDVYGNRTLHGPVKAIAP